MVIHLDKAVSLRAGDNQEVSFAPLELRHPHLWWPNGYGRPDLYRVRLQYKTAGGISDDTSFLIGVRSVGSRTTMVNGWLRRDFYVNGKRVHLVGGAWVPDMMLEPGLGPL